MHLTRTAELTDEIDALAGRYGGRVGLTAVLGDLDRRLRRTWAPCLTPHRAWTWDAADRRDERWWPQGVSPGPEPRLLGVTWYAKARGSRVSFLDLSARRYRHVTLVLPTADGYEPLRIHAGGLVWDGPYLYVAATGAGLWTCHTDDVLDTPDGNVLPVRFGYRAETDEGVDRLRFSFVSLESASSPPRLVVGEYGNSRQTRRLAHLALETGAVSVVDAGVLRAQGVAVVGDTYYLTSSHGPWRPGSVHVGRPGSFRERRYAVPMGPEDLAYDARDDRLWTVTEHPRRRWIVGIRRSRLGATGG